ncbi:uncharacterized protein DUF1572 [Thermolongibacillus altinsuensis]|jgi:hypothetical protein|uniref:Uncharacterized protein DUF1572 n=1 Tax=Thermolongibacillus altinsuensis TaxID=575256 RepID=A0A4R1QJG4_9BACL|nr:DUF1572 family protein [Thermolongibacillus altinsuensis]TCL51160.1 uncharacterized protein DUF1572 [Thermolongibacillus altinsuensis]GMB08772.1 hypothetical protein B1no1_14820 [Thermolongibacillus altinsuensis]
MSNNQSVASEYLRVVKARFEDMKKTAEKTFEQLDDQHLFWFPNDHSNSIAVIVKHMSGNMVSRWTDFLHSDGEKPYRDRDGEFENTISSREELYEVWNKGWDVFLKALESLKEEHLLQIIYIRSEPHTVIEAIERQMYHYSYHIGQIVYIAKQLKSSNWKSLTIPKKINH